MTDSSLSTPRPTLYVTTYVDEKGFTLRDALTFRTAEEMAADPEVSEVISHRPVQEAMEDEENEFIAHVQVVIFETPEAAAACVYGYGMACDWDDSSCFSRAMDGYAVAVLCDAGDVDTPEFKYVDRRKGETWDDVPGIWD